MKRLTISDPALVLALQDEIRRSEEARYDHRLHAILLVVQGVSGREAAKLLGDSPRTVQYWVRRFEDRGFAGLAEGLKVGRPKRLDESQLKMIDGALRKTPRDFGLSANLWDGKTLSAFIEKRCGAVLGTRQCQRMFRNFGFRLRKPRAIIANSDPAEKAKFKKKSAKTR